MAYCESDQLPESKQTLTRLILKSTYVATTWAVIVVVEVAIIFISPDYNGDTDADMKKVSLLFLMLCITALSPLVLHVHTFHEKSRGGKRRYHHGVEVVRIHFNFSNLK